MTHGAFVAVIYNAANRPELNQSLHEYLQRCLIVLLEEQSLVYDFSQAWQQDNTNRIYLLNGWDWGFEYSSAG